MRRYFEKLDADLEVLGFGLMRLPMNADNWFDDEVFDLLDHGYDLGINYFDTGFYYQNECSEELVREALVKRKARDSFYIADKMPVWDCSSREDMERIFEIQLDRLGVEYIDFYLLHALHKERWKKCYEAGVLDFLDKKKREGKIKRAGFSFHDSSDNMQSVVGAYDWDFAQVQLNYYDWVALHTEDNYKLLESSGIPCMTMETVGGGRLSVLPQEADEVFKSIHEDWTPSSWAMRFVAELPDVAVTLSGMNSIEQIDDNFRTCSEAGGLSEAEKSAITIVTDILMSKESIQCTACRYCVSECPKKIDIPQVIKSYNDYKIFDEPRYFDIAYNLLDGFPRAEDCIGCGRCEKKCPQNISIPENMKKIRGIAFEREYGADIHKLRMVLDSNGEICCFGCGNYGKRALRYLKGFGIRHIIFCDNNYGLWGKSIEGYDIISTDELGNRIKNEKVFVLIASPANYESIKNQLVKIGIQRGMLLN